MNHPNRLAPLGTTVGAFYSMCIIHRVTLTDLPPSYATRAHQQRHGSLHPSPNSSPFFPFFPLSPPPSLSHAHLPPPPFFSPSLRFRSRRTARARIAAPPQNPNRLPPHAPPLPPRRWSTAAGETADDASGPLVAAAPPGDANCGMKLKRRRAVEVVRGDPPSLVLSLDRRDLGPDHPDRRAPISRWGTRSRSVGWRGFSGWIGPGGFSVPVCDSSRWFGCGGDSIMWVVFWRGGFLVRAKSLSSEVIVLSLFDQERSCLLDYLSLADFARLLSLCICVDAKAMC